MPLDPEVQIMMNEMKAAGLPPVYWLPVSQARERLLAAFATKGEPEHVFSVENRYIPGPTSPLPIRIYRPSDAVGLGVNVFFHGGGWTVNNLETHDALCRSMTNRTGCVVISVDYRLAPEHKYPAAVDDSYLAVQWAANNAKSIGCDPTRIAVGGDSSGGTQAAIVSLLSRDRGGPDIAFQWMAYPATDYYLPGTASYSELATGYSMTRDWMIWFWNHYLPSDSDYSNPYIAPLRAHDLKGLPPALIMTAEYDPLRDEGEKYADMLAAAGVTVTAKRCDGLMHGFLMQRLRVKRAARAFDELCDAVAHAVGRVNADLPVVGRV